jgi:hypothetical protein
LTLLAWVRQIEIMLSIVIWSAVEDHGCDLGGRVEDGVVDAAV